MLVSTAGTSTEQLFTGTFTGHKQVLDHGEGRVTVNEPLEAL